MELSALLGLALPPLIDLINKHIASSNLRFFVALVICGLVASALHWKELVAGSWENVAGTASIIFTEAQIIFKLYWKESKVRENLKLAP